MGCGNSAGAADRRGGGLIIYGDYFNPQTRTLLAVVDVAGVGYNFDLVDQLAGEDKKDPYLQKNPTGSIPMIEQGGFKILGGDPQLLTFLCKNNKRISDMLYQKDLEVRQ